MAGAFTFGIEEEYFLVDAETNSLVRKMPQTFLEAANAAAAGRISPEFLQPQIEVISSPHDNMADARAELRDLRRTISAVAGEHGLAILAAGTHPTATWRKARQTEKERYDNVMHDLQMIGQRDVPLFLALSTSSPFWQSRRTGLKSYRLAAYDELPRTGVPELFRTREEFDAYVTALVRAGVIEDSSYIWWAIRPSLLNPTLELRAPDSCTLVEDSIAIAALYRTLVRHLYLNPWRNSDLSPVGRAIIVENKWQAQRHGVHAIFAAEDGALTVAETLERVIYDTAADADALGCSAEINRCRTIVSSGTSADAQLALFTAHRRNGSRGAALRAVADWIAAATLH